MTASRPDILIVGDLASPHVRRHAAALGDHGLRAAVACFEGDALPGVKAYRLGSQPVGEDRRYAAAIVPLARLLRERRPRVIHAHYVSSYGLLAALAARLAFPVGRRPALVQTAWGSDLLITATASTARRFLAGVALHSADLMTGDSVDLERAARRIAGKTPFQRFVFGPPTGYFEMLHRPDRIVLSTRRLDRDMRVGLAVAAFRSAKSRAPQMKGWRMVIAGDGLQSAELRRLAVDDPSILFVGNLTPTALRDELARAAIFISVPVSDATSASLLEAMAAGAVPVVNDLPANREWVDPQIGEIVPRDPSVEALGAAIVAAAQRTVDPALVRSRVRAVNWEDEIRRLVAIYRTLDS